METFRFGAASCVKMGAASGSLSSNFPFFPPSVPFFGCQGTQSSSFPARLLFLAQTTSTAQDQEQPYSDGFQKEAHFKQNLYERKQRCLQLNPILDLHPQNDSLTRPNSLRLRWSNPSSPTSSSDPR